METTKICITCNKSKLLSEYELRKDTQKHRGTCKKCINLKSLEYSKKNRAKKLASQKKYRDSHKEELRQKDIEYNKKNPHIRRDYYQRTKEANKESRKQYYLDNKDRFRQFILDNRELVAERRRKTRLRNIDYIKKWSKEYNNRNKEHIKIRDKKRNQTPEGKIKRRVYNNKRRAMKLELDDGTINDISLNKLKIKQNNKCYHCGCELKFDENRQVHLDHFIPLSKGGLHSINNVVWSCQTCNAVKGARLPDTFLLV